MKLIFESLKEIKEFIAEMGYIPKTTETTETTTKEQIVIEVPETKPRKNESGYFTVPELAEYCGVCQQAIDWHLKKKEDGLPFVWDYNHSPKRRMIKKSDAFEYFEKHPFQSTSGKKRKKTTKRKPVTVKVGFAKWRDEQLKKIESVGLEKNLTCHKIFNHLWQVYGIVWEQSKADFYHVKGRLPSSTMELCYFVQYEQEHKENEHYENLFENRLDEIIKSERKKVKA